MAYGTIKADGLINSSGSTVDLAEIATSEATTSEKGYQSAADKTKLDAIEAAATADQTGAEIKAAYEAEADTNAFTDADHAKLDGVEAGAQVNTVTSVNGATGAVTVTTFSGDYGDLSNLPTLGTAAATASTDYATAAQGTKADSALQAADITTKADLVGGKLSTSQVPDLSVSEYKGAVADLSAQLAIAGEKGDWVIRNDNSKVYVITGDTPTQSTSWTALSYPAGFSGAYGDLSGAPTIPTIDANTVIDANYVATDENFTTADHSKLDGIAAGAQVNAANTVIDANYVATDENFTTADHTKLDGIEAGAEVNIPADYILGVGPAGSQPFSTDTISSISSNTITLSSTTNVDKFKAGDAIGGAPATFKAMSYTGNNSNGRSFTGLGFEPGLLMFKMTNRTYQAWVYHDTLRGTDNFFVNFGSTSGNDTGGTLSSFDADGFTVDSGFMTNENGRPYAVYAFKAGSASYSNTEGSVTSTVSSSGSFSVVSQPGNAPTYATIGHGLNSAPKFIWAKSTRANWEGVFYHVEAGKDKWIRPPYTDIPSNTGNVWGTAEPTDSVFMLGVSDSANNPGIFNQAGIETIYYCWSDSANQKFSKYTGNGSTTGPVVNCGFEPAMIWFRSLTGTGMWYSYDNIMNSSNPWTNSFKINSNNAVATPHSIDITSTGFEINSSHSDINASGIEYMYCAFGEAVDESIINSVGSNTITVNNAVSQFGAGQTLNKVSNYGATLTYASAPSLTVPLEMTDGSGGTGILTATASAIEFTDGNTVALGGVTGQWLAGKYAETE